MPQIKRYQNPLSNFFFKIGVFFLSFINAGANLKNQDELRRVRIMNLTGVVMIIAAFTWAVLDLILLDRKLQPVLEFVAAAAGVFFLWWMRKSGNIELRTRVFVQIVAFFLLTINLVSILRDGPINSNSPWLLLIPLIAFFASGEYIGLIWTWLIFCWLSLFAILSGIGICPPSSFEELLDFYSVFFLISLFSFLYERARRGSQEGLSQRNEEMERFVYVVSHDLRSPLTCLRGYLDEIREMAGEGLGLIDGDLKKTEKLVENMGGMIDDLLSLSSVGKADYMKERVDMGRCVSDVLGNFEIQLREKGFKISVKGQMPWLKVYKQPLMEVFNNLISNAIKFTEDQPEPRIEVGIERCPQGYNFYVRDNGVGIPAGDADKVFELFYSHGKKAGRGIGLSIVKEYIKMHGGRVWVESEKGKGSTFWFFLPGD